jgi:hypothetical protein
VLRLEGPPAVRHPFIASLRALAASTRENRSDTLRYGTRISSVLPALIARIPGRDGGLVEGAPVTLHADLTRLHLFGPYGARLRE